MFGKTTDFNVIACSLLHSIYQQKTLLKGHNLPTIPSLSLLIRGTEAGTIFLWYVFNWKHVRMKLTFCSVVSHLKLFQVWKVNSVICFLLLACTLFSSFSYMVWCHVSVCSDDVMLADNFQMCETDSFPLHSKGVLTEQPNIPGGN